MAFSETQLSLGASADAFYRNRYLSSREIEFNLIGPNLDLSGNGGTKNYNLTANFAVNETFDVMAILMPLAPGSGF
jgi:hypothetical protein